MWHLKLPCYQACVYFHRYALFQMVIVIHESVCVYSINHRIVLNPGDHILLESNYNLV